jgi:two-component system, NtrC family, nitrogen regulation sensor histidine kinase GlnL
VELGIGVGLDLVPSAIVLLDASGNVTYINSAAEQVLAAPLKLHLGMQFSAMFAPNEALSALVSDGLAGLYGERSQEITLTRVSASTAVLYQALAGVIDAPHACLLIDLRPLDQRQRLDRESRLNDSAQANRELVRNLAHEIKNPLGGIRGAAQLLGLELTQSSQREYTQVIIKEADRLQNLVDRLLAPHRRARSLAPVNIHEVCERVRSLVLAEYPQHLRVQRDYDASLPEFQGDKEQLIQTVLNLVHNAAQALSGRGTIVLRTRVGRKVVLHHQIHKLALELHVCDDGPGIPEHLLDRIFFPLVSGREGGSGLGLSLAQTFVHQHGGTITCQTQPGLTDFTILLPL